MFGFNLSAQSYLKSALCCVAMIGCTDTDLTMKPSTIAIKGSYSTQDASIYDVPTRVLLIIDTSGSMRENDTGRNRRRASENLIDQLTREKDDVSFAFVTFSDAAVAQTDGFTSDRAELDSVLPSLELALVFTNYVSALSTGRSIIEADAEKTAQEIQEKLDAGEDVRFIRPEYYVIFLSDGLPNIAGGTQTNEEILDKVEDLVEVPEFALGVRLHTAFLGANNGSDGLAAEQLLKKMAETGQGDYTSFEKGEDIDFTLFDLEVKRLFDIKQFVAFNRHSAFFMEMLMVDSDADGIADQQEIELGTDLTLQDTDQDGFSDGFELRAALDPLAPNKGCSESDRIDTDNDGLLDCEEQYLHFDKDRFDTDGDLLPDGLEYYSGGNPADSADVEEDLDFDGVLTGEEIRTRTDPRRNDNKTRAEYAYTYQIARNFNTNTGQVSYDFQVGNLSLLKTAQTAEHAEGENEIVVYVIESPEDDPMKYFKLLRAVVKISASTGRKNKVVNLEKLEFEVVAWQKMINSR